MSERLANEYPASPPQHWLLRIVCPRLSGQSLDNPTSGNPAMRLLAFAVAQESDSCDTSFWLQTADQGPVSRRCSRPCTPRPQKASQKCKKFSVKKGKVKMLPNREVQCKQHWLHCSSDNRLELRPKRLVATAEEIRDELKIMNQMLACTGGFTGLGQ